MKVCIYGAGASGGWGGLRRARAGCDVSVVARGATLEAIREHGLRLKENDEELSSSVRTRADPAEQGEQDLVVIAVKSQSMADVAMSIAPLRNRRPLRCRASSVAPRATTLTSQPARASRTPIQPPMAPAP